MTRGKRNALTPKRIKPLYGAKKSLPIIERNLDAQGDSLTPQRQQFLRSNAALRTSAQPLGVDKPDEYA